MKYQVSRLNIIVPLSKRGWQITRGRGGCFGWPTGSGRTAPDLVWKGRAGQGGEGQGRAGRFNNLVCFVETDQLGAVDALISYIYLDLSRSNHLDMISGIWAPTRKSMIDDIQTDTKPILSRDV
jgi:hypothetical protein